MSDNLSTEEPSANNLSSTSQLKCDYCRQAEANVTVCIMHSGPTIQLCPECVTNLSDVVKVYSPFE